MFAPVFLPIFAFLNQKTNLMTSTSSKTLGVRMPFPEYMDLLQKAQENKTTISDFALQLILYNKNKMTNGGNLLSNNASAYNLAESQRLYREALERISKLKTALLANDDFIELIKEKILANNPPREDLNDIIIKKIEKHIETHKGETF